MARRELYDELPSTQDRAVELAREGAEEGSVVVARRQLRGRGRGARAWESPAGGLYVSVVLRTDRPLPLLPLAIGSELAAALAMEHAVRLRLRWPNDLFAVDGAGGARKLAGVLTDQVTDRSGGSRPVVGIGVNAAAPAGWSPAVRQEAVALEELTGRPVDLDQLEALVATAAVRARRALSDAGGERVVLARARGLLYGRGEPVTVDGRPVGTLTGIREDGGVDIAGPDGPQALFAGEFRVGFGP